MNRNWRRGFSDVLAAIAASQAAIALTSEELDLRAGHESSDNLLTWAGGIALPSGFILVTTTARWVITQLDGTITTGPTANCGNNVAKTNVLGSAIQITAANLNTAFANGLPNPVPAGNTTNLTLFQQRDTINPYKVDITTGATLNTATKLKGHLLVVGSLVVV